VAAEDARGSRCRSGGAAGQAVRDDRDRPCAGEGGGWEERGGYAISLSLSLSDLSEPMSRFRARRFGGVCGNHMKRNIAVCRRIRRRRH
jgi:hypothetical protein